MSSDRSVAIITGASRGIGRAIALELAKAGFDLAICARQPGQIAETQAMAEREGATVHTLCFDVTDTDASEGAVQKAAAYFGRVDVLVNNAAARLAGDVLDATPEDWHYILDTNLKSAFFLCQSFGRQAIQASRGGRIVNLASTHGISPLKGRGLYGISKAGIIHMTRALAVEWAEYGITVNCVAPATISSPDRQMLIANPQQKELMIRRIPAGRFGRADEVAAAVLFLVNGNTDFITGHTLVIDGGLTVI